MADFDPVSYMMGQKSAGGGGGSGSGSSTLAGLTDVDLTNPTDGQTLVYDATSQKWVNGSGGGSTNQIFVFTPFDTDKVTIGGTDYSLFYADPDPLPFFLASPDVIDNAVLAVQCMDIETAIAYNTEYSLFKGMTATAASPASVPGNAIYADPPVACLYIEDMVGHSYVVVPNNVTYLQGSPE